MTHTQDTPRTLPDFQVLLTTLYAGFRSQCLHPEVTSHTVEPQTVSIRLTSATSPVCAGPRCGRQGRADRTIDTQRPLPTIPPIDQHFESLHSLSDGNSEVLRASYYMSSNRNTGTVKIDFDKHGNSFMRVPTEKGNALRLAYALM